MFNSKSPFISTIIITEELHTDIRGYSLIGREFILKEPEPREDFAITLEGCRIKDKYWVISKAEYMRVVSEARTIDFDSEEVYIPLFVARKSFRPSYLNTTKIVL